MFIILFPLWAFACASTAFVLMYVVPAIVLSDASPSRAISRSCELASTNAGRTVVVGLVLFAANICAPLISLALNLVPVFGLILLPLAIHALAAAFSAVLLSMVYLELTTRQKGVALGDAML